MRMKVVLLCWLVAVVLLAWPVQIRALGSELACGAAGVAFARDVTPSDGPFGNPVSSACAGEAYPYVAVAAGLFIGAPVVASLGWRQRRRRRVEQKRALKLGKEAVKAQRPQQPAQG